MRLRSIVVALVVTVPVVLLFRKGMEYDPRYIPPAIPGQPAPEFALERLESPQAPDAPGRPDTVRLSDHRGRVVVLNFWASWCVPCRQEHPALVRAAEEYADRGVAFLGVLYDDTPRNARRWLEEFGGEVYPTLLDPGSRTAIDYGLTGVPETVIIDAGGTVVFKRYGPIDYATLAGRIEPLLAGRRGTAGG